MKIAHISIIPAYSAGIFKKLEDKARVSKGVNLDIDFYLINPVNEYRHENLFMIKTDYEWVFFSFLKLIFFRIFKLNSLVRLIDLDKYDAIVLRYPLSDSFGKKKFLRQYGKKIFTEHHSDEISELIAVGRLVDRVRAWIEQKYSSDFLSQVKGIIGVTDEIRLIELQKIGNFNKPSSVIANGIDISSVPFLGFQNFDGRILKLVFIASSFAIWHGLEKLLLILKDYNNFCQLELTLIGDLSSAQLEIINKLVNQNVKIVCLGSVYGDKLNIVLSNSNLAISSLGLSSNKMKEACPLKSREYIARGLPFIYAYKDTDLTGDEMFAKYISEDNISIEEIIEFSRYVTEYKSQVLQEMQIYAKEKIDWSVKLKIMKNFLQKNMK